MLLYEQREFLAVYEKLTLVPADDAAAPPPIENSSDSAAIHSNIQCCQAALFIIIACISKGQSDCSIYSSLIPSVCEPLLK